MSRSIDTSSAHAEQVRHVSAARNLPADINMMEPQR